MFYLPLNGVCDSRGFLGKRYNIICKKTWVFKIIDKFFGLPVSFIYYTQLTYNLRESQKQIVKHFPWFIQANASIPKRFIRYIWQLAIQFFLSDSAYVTKDCHSGSGYNVLQHSPAFHPTVSLIKRSYLCV